VYTLQENLIKLAQTVCFQMGLVSQHSRLSITTAILSP